MTEREKLRLAQEQGQSQWKKAAETQVKTEKNQKSAQAAARLDHRISSPYLDYAVGSWQSAFAADRLNNGRYTATGGVKQREIAQKAKAYRQNIRSAQLAANLDNSLVGQETRDNQRTYFESAMESLYNQMEIAKSANQMDKYNRAQERYSNTAKMLQDLNNPTSTAAYAADWESRRRNEIMATDDRVLMPKLERLLDLQEAKTRDAGEQGDERRNGLTENEKQYFEIYNSLKAQYGDPVDGWIEYAKRMENRAKMAEKEKKTKQAAENNPFWSSVGSVPLNAFSGAGYLDVVAQKMQRGITGSDAPIDYNRAAQSASKMTNTIRGTVSEDMSGVGSFLYNTAMSMGDTLAAMPMGGFGMALLGGSAATNAMQQAVERGASDNQALAIGLVSGAMEAVMEKMSIDKLFGLKTPEAAKDVVLNALKQAGAEGTEEGLTTIANTLADGLIMGNRSELQTAKRAYMAEGYSAERAERLALKEWGQGLALDVAGGMLSGGAFGSAKAAGDTYLNRNVIDVYSGMAYNSIGEEIEFDRQFMDGFNSEESRLSERRPMAEETKDGQKGLYLRNSGQRDGSSDSGRPVSAVEEGAGRNPGWQKRPESGKGEAAVRADEPKVNPNAFDFPDDFETTGIRIVTGEKTADTRVARRIAQENGLQVTFFEGGNLQVRNVSGKMDSVRGYIRGEQAFVRADHPVYTADQIMRHEAGHGKIARGELDPDAVRQQIGQRFGRKRVEKLSSFYEQAYEGSGLSEAEIWEEVVCDSLGGMNIFREFRIRNRMEPLLNSIRGSAETETAAARGPTAEDTNVPDKMSRDKLIGKEFPPYNISHSDANEWATRWAHQDDVRAGDQKLFSYHGSWYLVEAFDNAELGYQIVKKLTKQQYNAYVKEKLENGNISEVQEDLSQLGEIDREREWAGRRKRSADPVQTGQRGKDFEVRTVGKEQNEERKAAGDGRGNLPRRRSSIEEARLEFENSRVFQLSAQIQRLDAARKKAPKGLKKKGA